MTWLRAPRFWQEEGLAAKALSPAACLVAQAAKLRWKGVEPEAVGVPVICVGNLVAGGAGKTPVAIDLLTKLRASGRKAFALTRGYGGRAKGPLLVDSASQDWRDVGDEALLLARAAPTVVSRDRPDGAVFAIDQGADLLVMDDGFQNPSLRKDLSLLVVDGGYGLGNGRVLPAGPLRELPGDAFARASAVVLIGDDATGLAHRLPRGLPLLRADLSPTPGAPGVSGKRLVAFAGIGRPRKFFDSLKSAGAEMVASVAFPDHYPYRESDIALILRKAQDLDATAITTEKDWVRLPKSLASGIETFPVSLKWRDSATLWRLLEGLLDHE